MADSRACFLAGIFLSLSVLIVAPVSAQAAPSASASEALQTITVLSVTIVLVYFSLKRLREVKRTRSILEGTAPLAISGREEKDYKHPSPNS